MHMQIFTAMAESRRLNTGKWSGEPHNVPRQTVRGLLSKRTLVLLSMRTNHPT